MAARQTGGMAAGDRSITRAAIDIGTNSLHLVVAQVDRRGNVDIITREKESVRLGHGAGEMQHLSSDAIDRGIAALKRFRKIIDTYPDTKVSAVATSAVREALNKDEFIQRAEREAGITVNVISGAEEARLIHLGAMQAVPMFDKQHLVIDIGGGSTEFVVGVGSHVDVARSLKLGAIRLTDQFFAGDAVTRKAVKECREYVRSYLEPVAHEIDEWGFDVAVGSSGTILALAGMADTKHGRDPGRRGASLTASDLRELVDDLCAAPNKEARAALPGLDAKRADIIVAGALLLEQIVERLHIEELVVSEFALREGVLFDAAHGSLHQLSNIRQDSVQRVVDRFERDRPHVEHATELSLQLFDALRDMHGLGEPERELFEAAGLLHNIGLFISHSSHHKHSYYLIRNTDHLAGFTQHELEIMALIARYHRKGAPSARHTEFATLTQADQQVVRILAGFLRIGIALDRTHARHVTGLDINCEGSRIEVMPKVASGIDINVELYAANQRKDLAEAALGRKIRIGRN